MFEAPLVVAQAESVARVFKALGDPVRLRLLSLITSAGGEMCVSVLLDIPGLVSS